MVQIDSHVQDIETTSNRTEHADQQTFNGDFNSLLQNSSHDELNQEINEKEAKITFWKWLSMIILSSAIFVGTDALLVLTILPIVYLWDQNRKSVVILYDFDEQGKTF